MAVLKLVRNIILLVVVFLSLTLVGCPHPHPSNVPVPNVAGLTPAAAQTAITTAGLTVGSVTQAYSATVPASHVISQNPAAGANVSLGSAVHLEVSKGPQPALAVTPSQRPVTAVSGTTSFTVSNTTAGTMEWTATVTQGSAWLAITSASTATGIINVSYNAHSGTTTRTGAITVTAPGAIDSPATVSVVQSPPAAQPPAITAFSINNGAASTSSRTVTLNNTCTGSPTDYMASESSAFLGAAWQTYAVAPSFSLSSGNGTKTVYFKVKNTSGESNLMSDTILLDQSTAAEETILLPGNVPLVMVRIPAGTFQMGSPDTEQGRNSAEGPVHTVNVGYDFRMGKYEVTQSQWLAVMGSAPHTWGSGVGDNYPAYNVSWYDAKFKFIKALNTHIASTNQGAPAMRLPSEAEWEYACRAGTQTRFSFGDSLTVEDVCEPDDGLRIQYMWYDYCDPNIPALSSSQPVGGLLPNDFGLYDMHGNLWEWCEDDWHGSYTGAPIDGRAWVNNEPSTSYRLLRGGGWFTIASGCRSAYRFSARDFDWYYLYGFRLAADR